MRRLLVIVVTRIGDTLLATPTMRALASAFPEAEITVLAHPKRMPLLLNLPFIAHLSSITKHTALLRGWLGVAGKRYDAALVFGHDAALLKYALRVSHKVVAQTQKDPRFPRQVPGLTFVEDAPGKEHSVHLGLRLARALGAKPAGLFLSCVVSAEEQSSARQRLQALCSTLGDPALPAGGVARWVGVQLQSFPTKAYRDWPLGHFVQLLQRLFSAAPDVRVVVLGDAASVNAAEKLMQRFPQQVTSVAGKTDLRQTAAVISLLTLYIGVDTGPTHLAGALGVPMVALYHCKHRGRHLAPLDHPSLSVIEHPASDDQCGNQSSMSEISVDVVWSAVQKRLQIDSPESR